MARFFLKKTFTADVHDDDDDNDDDVDDNNDASATQTFGSLRIPNYLLRQHLGRCIFKYRSNHQIEEAVLDTIRV